MPSASPAFPSPARLSGRSALPVSGRGRIRSVRPRSWSGSARDCLWRRAAGVLNKPDADLVNKALDMAYEQRGRPQGLLFHSDRAAIWQSSVLLATLALSHPPEHESSWKLLGQRADGAVFRSLKTEWIPTVAPERNREHSIRGSGSAFECVGDGSVTIFSRPLQG